MGHTLKKNASRKSRPPVPLTEWNSFNTTDGKHTPTRGWGAPAGGENMTLELVFYQENTRPCPHSDQEFGSGSCQNVINLGLTGQNLYNVSHKSYKSYKVLQEGCTEWGFSLKNIGEILKLQGFFLPG